MTEILLIALAVSSTSMTIAETRLFKPLRDWAARHTPWLGHLLVCPYCLSYWIAFAFVGWFRPRPGIDGFVLVSFAVVALASFASYILCDFFRLLEN